MKDINSKNILEGFNRLPKREQQLLLNDMEEFRFTFEDMANPKKGSIAKVFGQGGGIQIQLGSNLEYYEVLGFLKEVE